MIIVDRWLCEREQCEWMSGWCPSSWCVLLLNGGGACCCLARLGVCSPTCTPPRYMALCTAVMSFCCLVAMVLWCRVCVSVVFVWWGILCLPPSLVVVGDGGIVGWWVAWRMVGGIVMEGRLCRWHPRPCRWCPPPVCSVASLNGGSGACCGVPVFGLGAPVLCCAVLLLCCPSLPLLFCVRWLQCEMGRVVCVMNGGGCVSRYSLLFFCCPILLSCVCCRSIVGSVVCVCGGTLSLWDGGDGLCLGGRVVGGGVRGSYCFPVSSSSSSSSLCWCSG